MEILAVVLSLATLVVVAYLVRTDQQVKQELVKEIKAIDKRDHEHEVAVAALASKLTLIIRMLRQHMKDGEVLVQIGTSNDKKLINALQAAGIYVQFDEFPQTELGRSKVISEMLGGEDHG